MWWQSDHSRTRQLVWWQGGPGRTEQVGRLVRSDEALPVLGPSQRRLVAQTVAAVNNLRPDGDGERGGRGGTRRMGRARPLQRTVSRVGSKSAPCISSNVIPVSLIPGPLTAEASRVPPSQIVFLPPPARAQPRPPSTHQQRILHQQRTRRRLAMESAPNVQTFAGSAGAGGWGLRRLDTRIG